MDKLRAQAEAEVQADLGNQTLLERFEGYSRLADTVAAGGVVGIVFASVTHWKSYIPPPEQQLSLLNWIDAGFRFFEDNGWAPVLAVVAIISHVAGRVFARKNIGQLRSMFADENTPTGFQLVGRGQLFLMIHFQLAMALSMIYWANIVWIPCVCWIVLHSMYLYSNYRQRTETPRLFGTPKYKPRETHPHRTFILTRRAAGERYLARPHDVREYFVICCAIVAIGFEIGEKKYGFAHGDTKAYVAIISGVLLNEVIVGLWRRELERALGAANLAQLVFDRSRDL